MSNIQLTASLYQQFDADDTLDVPAEGYGGWRQLPLEIDLAHTAVVIMHAWNHGARADFPGWYRAVEYIPRANAILHHVFPPLLAALRAAGITIFHVVGGGDYYRNHPGYRRAVALAGPEASSTAVVVDPGHAALRALRDRHVFVGEHNRLDVSRGFAALDFPPQARPLAHEGIAENAYQLTALCNEADVNHLIYAGFAVNWCLLMSPGGMVDMSRRGALCSVLRQAVTAVENKESARTQAHKEEALWRIALAFGFVFEVDDLIAQARRLAARQNDDAATLPA